MFVMMSPLPSTQPGDYKKVQLVPGSAQQEAVRIPPAELLNSNSIQLWNSLCVAGHEGLNGGIQIIPLLQPLLVAAPR